MKHLLVFIAVVVGLAIPCSAWASDAPSVDGGRSGHWLRYMEVIGHGPNRVIYYYTNVVLTGTHLPVVIRRYKGQMEIVSGGMLQGVSYGFGDLSKAGANDVAGELRGLDPSISVGGSRH